MTEVGKSEPSPEGRAKEHVTASHIEVHRTARYFTLGANTAVPRELWIVLHGIGQLAETFVRYFADLDDDETVIVAPEALNRYYLVPFDSAPAHERPVGATWMTRVDRDADIADYVAYLDTLHHALGAKWPAATPTINVIGFSQGAATVSRWCALGTSRVDRWILWGGLVPPDLDLATLGRALNGRALTIVIGDSDKYLTTAAVVAERVRLERAGIAVDVVGFEGGHAINRFALKQLRG
jgi:predicted esterase